ncbi:MAG: RidA family protein [Methanobacteriota archaeon]|nr:MAG: RidA family protein [Euryarchaeota archaeon]
MDYEERLHRLGLKLSPVPTPLGNYLPAVRVNNLLILSGVLPIRGNTLAYTGRVGEEITIEQGYEAARTATINALSIIKNELGSLNNVERVLRLVGYVSSGEHFTQQSRVVDGASDLLVDVFGENGKHARVAVGVAWLPGNSPVELELVVSIKETKKES